MKELLYFGADWCGPCKQLGPIMEELKAEGYHVRKINVDTNPDAAKGFGIKQVPTVILSVDGVDSGRKLGFNPKSMYIELYNQTQRH
jgi:thioredoxin 1